ncbi:hypothetical protein HKD37_02G004967 [Glycine soja]
MQKEVESKQQQEKLECEELFNNLYAHVGPQFLVERMETNLLIKNILEALLKSFNDSVLFNISMLMQQRFPPIVQPLLPPLALTFTPTISKIHVPMPVPPPSPPKSPPLNPPPPSTED